MDVTLEPDPGLTAPRASPGLHGSASITRHVLGGRAVVLKSASGPGRDRLRREAVVLRALRELPVVELHEVKETDDMTELVLGDDGRTSLDALDGSGQRLAKVLVATCEAVARLHACGWYHGQLTLGHVLVGPRDRVRLCSLARAGQLADGRGERDRDRAALLRMVERAVERSGSENTPAERFRSRRFRRRLIRRTSRLPDAPDPRTLTRIIRSTTPGPRHHSRVVAACTVLAIVCLVGAGLAALMATSDAGVLADGDPAPTSVDTDGDEHSDRIQVNGNVLRVGQTTFRIGQPGDLIVATDSDCTGESDVFVLRPGTGEIFGFRDWATVGRPTTGELLTVAPGAVDLRPAVGTCGPARVILADGSEFPVGVSP